MRIVATARLALHVARTRVVPRDRRSLCSAAARLHVVQPAVSQTLRNLEVEVGARLLERTSRRVVLTEAGSAFLVHAKRSVEAAELAVVAARRAAVGELGSLVIHFTAMSTFTALPSAIAHFRSRYPDVDLRLHQGSTESTIAALQRGQCDLGFTALAAPVPELIQEAISEDPLVVVLPATHPRARQRSVHFDDVAFEPVIVLPRAAEPGIRTRHEAACENAGTRPNVVLEVDTVEGMLAFVAHGLGVAFLPASVRALRPRGVRAVPISPFEPARVYAVRPTVPTAAAERFLDVLRATNAADAERAHLPARR